VRFTEGTHLFVVGRVMLTGRKYCLQLPPSLPTTYEPSITFRHVAAIASGGGYKNADG